MPIKRRAEPEPGSRAALTIRWQAAYGCPPPSGVRTDLLDLSDGWHRQAERLGGLARDTRRRLSREVARIVAETQVRRGAAGSGTGDGIVAGIDAADASDTSSRASDPGVTGVAAAAVVRDAPERRVLSPGARLLRDWNGRAHAVDVTAGGYLYDGTTYRSLSAVARTITGAHWSGPRFFGL